MTTAAPTAISVQNLHYGVRHQWSYRLREILKGLTFSVPVGESFGFIGHNGAGKTTAIKCLLGLLQPSAGEINLFGKSTAEAGSRQAVGYLAEQPYFYDHLTVRELRELYRTLAGVPQSELPGAITRVLDTVKVSGRSKSPMRSLSKGLTQRVALAQAIIADPKLLILDEPFSGLDPIGRREFREIFHNFKKSGSTLFICSHVLPDVEFLCDRVAILARGELKGVFTVGDIPRLSAGEYEIVVSNAAGATEQLQGFNATTAHTQKLLHFTTAERAEAERILRKVLELGLHLESYEFKQGTLEELFVNLVTFTESESGGQHA